MVRSRRGEIKLSGVEEYHGGGDPLDLLGRLLDRYKSATVRDLPPFQGGAAGVFGYDLCHHIERLPRPRHDEFETPDLHVGFYDVVFAFDHHRKRAWIVSTGFPELKPRRRKRRAARRASWMKELLACRPRDQEQAVGDCLPSMSGQYPVPGYPDLLSNFNRETYLEAAGRIVEYIAAGDCFQVNLAQRLLYPARLPPHQLYRRLRSKNPAPFGAYYDLGDFQIASASPERFLLLRNGEVETRPIKGTRPRGQSRQEDAAYIQALENSSKDRAENIMIVDLLRNDLGRVCKYGSIRVPSVCHVESYQYVHHLVSEVRGRLREGLGPVDLLRAAFPGGSVTGAPKIRAMEIIAELESSSRGPYCGSLAYIGFDGNMDSNILIRTITVGKRFLQFPVGGAIVADSVPEREYEETWYKAEGLLRAVLR